MVTLVAVSGKSSNRIPTLDGLRAISIAMVLSWHAIGTRGAQNPALLWLFKRVDLAQLGVRVFFVISGFLITTLLIEERAGKGDISIKQFYVRRAYRIFPAFYFFLGVVLGLQHVGVISLFPGDALHAATYTTNFHADRAWWLGHLWSLSVEEQFYLLWPTVILFVGLRGAMSFAVLSVVLAPLLRVAIWIFAPSMRTLIGEAFPTIFDTIATGCLLAGLRDRLWASARYRALLGSRWFWAIPALGFAAAILRSTAFNFLAGQTLLNVAIALTIDRCVRHPERLSGRLLEKPFLVWLGSLSYSLYLWQQPFINRHSQAIINRFPVNVMLALLAGIVSYYFIERPFLRWRARRTRTSSAVGAARVA